MIKLKDIKSYSNKYEINKIDVQANNFDIVPLLKVQHTKWLFLALCCYLLSQSFTIPIFPIGPSWALWPCLSDFAIALLIITFLINIWQTPPLSKPAKSIFLILFLVLYGSTLSYLSYLASANDTGQGRVFGIFQIYRLVQFITVFFITAKIPLTPKRIAVLNRIMEIVVIFICLGIFLTYSTIVPLSAVTAHLPQVGPWPEYAAWGNSGEGRGVGFISYNYAYTAVQVLLSITLKLCLSNSQKQEFRNSRLVLLSVFGCFLSSSRSGLAGIVLLAIIYWQKNSKSFLKAINFLVITTLILLIVLLFLQLLGFNIDFDLASQNSIFERQVTLLDARTSDNLSGRDEIWKERVEFLNENLIRWIVGTGFGSALDSGNFAHMLPLHIIIETGLIGLCAFTFLFYKILDYFYIYEVRSKPFFWGSIALLFTSTSQETFYPLPAFTHFIGFYLCALAIAFQTNVK